MKNRILIIAPHADDEVLGMGGTMARAAAAGHDVVVAILTGHGDDAPHPLWPASLWERIRAEAAEAHQLLGVRDTLVREIPAVGVADEPHWKINQVTAGILAEVRPDLLYVPFRYDPHKDHRELTLSFSVAWRPCTEAGRRIRSIYMYETSSETHWQIPGAEPAFAPNTWVDISAFLERKLAAMACFKSQVQPFPGARSLKALQALAEWRGSQISAAAAEAFMLVRHMDSGSAS